MIVGLVCNCSGSTSLIRDTFKKAGLVDWLTIPVYYGKNGYKDFKMSLPDSVLNLKGFDILDYSMSQSGSYALVVGYNDHSLIYTDVKRRDPKTAIHAQVIIDKFA